MSLIEYKKKVINQKRIDQMSFFENVHRPDLYKQYGICVKDMSEDRLWKWMSKYFDMGDDVKVDEEIDIEWARIPHFYYNFYVYQYATGLSASCALAERVLSGEKGAKEQYLTFLGSGSSKFPLDTLADAGVDMRSSKPVEALIAKFNKLVAELQQLLT